MSYTQLQNRFWSDGWVRKLNALDRYLFLYLLSNGRSSLTGIYELPIDMMATESGIDEKDLRMSMLQRLEPKIYYREGWIIIVNYPKHHTSTSRDFWKGVANEFSKIPKKIQEIAISYGYPPQTLPTPSHIIDKNRIDINTPEKDISATPKKSYTVQEEGKKEKGVLPLYKELITWAENRRGFPFLKIVGQYKAFKIARENNIQPDRLMERWKELEGQDKKFDWMTVVYSFNKKQ